MRKWFIPALYRELDPGTDQRFRAHLESCPACRQAYEGMAGTLAHMDRRERTDPGERYWQGYWDRLENRLDPVPAHGAKRFPRARPVPSWSLRLAAAAALVVLGIGIGRMTRHEKGRPAGAAVQSGTMQMTALETRTSRYLQRSRMLLLGLVNFDADTEDPAALNFPQSRKISRELLQESDTLKTALGRSSHARLQSLISDLEVILLQIANLEQEQDLQAVELVKDGVDRRGILLKINLETMRKAPEPGTGTPASPAV